ncbi:hypothetical protein CHS0354_038302 [Potamilus streckersoni]|uniref:TIR domain-containing protein n=1 Tax=Potamilus streckersoni TaxID=2493646 RepID=A0AAE0TCJ7_9BIVA|nr:hypothetical protein CHS0354_038302 [Potamilus streckersoni]
MRLCTKNDPALVQPPTGYRSWIPRDRNRTDLFCPIECSEEEDQEECCFCMARVCWEINPSFCNLALHVLHVEYMDVNGTSRVLHIDSAVNETIYVLKHTDGYLTTFPTNLNEYIDIVIIDLSRNRIKEIAKISFLDALSVLVLDGNLLTYISNNTFIGLTRLRQVSLAQNLITHIEPNSFFTSELSIFQMNISQNQLTDIDATLFLPTKGFCEIDVSKNIIENLINPTAFTLNTTPTYGPGKLNLEHNNINLPNWTKIGVSNWIDLGKNVMYEFNINFQTKMTCDCIVFHYFDKIKLSNMGRLLTDNNFLECSSPEHLAGKTLVNLYDEGNYDDLICNITIDCPRHCHCYDQPSRSNVVVDCEGKGLTDLPEGPLPGGFWGNQRLELRMKNNNITKIGTTDYIDRIVYVDLTGNSIGFIEDSAAKAMREDIELNLPDSNLQFLPSSFVYLDPNKINTGNNIFLCSCEMIWMENWQYKLLGNKTGYYCSHNGRVMPVSKITYNMHCETQKEDRIAKILPASLVAIGTVLLVMILCLNFWYEIRILFARVISRMTQTKIQNPKVFISHDESDKEIRVWVMNDLYPCLRCEGVNEILSYLDYSFGEYQETETKSAILKCNAYIVILSQNYNQQDLSCVLEEENPPKFWTKTEFSYIWNECFNLKQTKLLIVINFHQLRPGHYKDRRLRALCRVGNVLDFRQREEKMLNRIKNVLNISRRYERPLQESLSIVSCDEINDTVSERETVVRRNNNRKNSFLRNSVVPMRLEPQSIPTFEVTRRYHNSKPDYVAKTTFRPS